MHNLTYIFHNKFHIPIHLRKCFSSLTIKKLSKQEFLNRISLTERNIIFNEEIIKIKFEKFIDEVRILDSRKHNCVVWLSFRELPSEGKLCLISTIQNKGI